MSVNERLPKPEDIRSNGATKLNNTVLNTLFSEIKKLKMSSKKKERTNIKVSKHKTVY